MTCSKCKTNETRSPGQRYCKCCHAGATRKRRSLVEMTSVERMKSNCRSYLHVYVKRGLIKKEPCAVCGCNHVEAHHHDYAKPLDVVWLCRKHHLEVHAQTKIKT